MSSFQISSPGFGIFSPDQNAKSSKSTSDNVFGSSGTTFGFGQVGSSSSSSSAAAVSVNTSHRENPLLKKGESSSLATSNGNRLDSNAGFGRVGVGAPSFGGGRRSPLAPVGQYSSTKKSFGPPPKASLSLGTGPTTPGFLPQRQTQQQQQQQQQQQHLQNESPAPPAPVESPRPNSVTTMANALSATASSPLSTSAAMTSTFASTTTTNIWVVAYGYRTPEEYEYLKLVMMSYGNVVQVKTQAPQQQHESSSAFFAQPDGKDLILSGGNWLAVQYESEFAAQQAICNQPYVLTCTPGSATICGVINGSQNGILDRLVAASKSTVITTRPDRKTSADKMLHLPAHLQGQTLTESDILNLPRAAADQAMPPDGTMHISICQKLFCWLLGWDPEDVAKKIAAAEHAHSD